MLGTALQRRNKTPTFLKSTRIQKKNKKKPVWRKKYDEDRTLDDTSSSSSVPDPDPDPAPFQITQIPQLQVMTMFFPIQELPQEPQEPLPVPGPADSPLAHGRTAYDVDTVAFFERRVRVHIDFWRRHLHETQEEYQMHLAHTAALEAAWTRRPVSLFHCYIQECGGCRDRDEEEALFAVDSAARLSLAARKLALAELEERKKNQQPVLERRIRDMEVHVKRLERLPAMYAKDATKLRGLTEVAHMALPNYYDNSYPAGDLTRQSVEDLRGICYQSFLGFGSEELDDTNSPFHYYNPEYYHKRLQIREGIQLLEKRLLNAAKEPSLTVSSSSTSSSFNVGIE